MLATNDVDALLALDADCVSYTATADLRPMDAITDMARILRVGQERRVELGRRRDLAAAPRAVDAQAARGRVRGGRRVVLHVGHRSRAGRTTSCRCCSRARARTSSTLRVMEIVNYKDYEQPTVLFDTMGFGKALDAKPLLLIPGVLTFAWGGVIKVLADGPRRRDRRDRARSTNASPRPSKIDLGFGVIEEGTTAALRFEVQGIVGGEPRIVVGARHPPRRRRCVPTGRSPSARAATAWSSPARRATSATCR